jgi:DNA-binding IclR family transcriptional regulator
MILTCFSPGRPVRTSQEIGDSVGLSAVTVERLTARMVRLGLICEDATGVYRVREPASDLEVKDQR